jgi:hypothetical protein
VVDGHRDSPVCHATSVASDCTVVQGHVPGCIRFDNRFTMCR